MGRYPIVEISPKSTVRREDPLDAPRIPVRTDTELEKFTYHVPLCPAVVATFWSHSETIFQARRLLLVLTERDDGPHWTRGVSVRGGHLKVSGEPQRGIVMTSVFFSTNGILDLFEQRLNLLRVPEVMRVIRRAQEIIDRKLDSQVDLASYMSFDDEAFLNSSHLRSLCLALAQIGLYHRHVKTHGLPEFVIGNCRGDSAIEVVVGRVPIEQLVLKCAAFQENREAARVASNGLPVLVGTAMPEMVIYQRRQVSEVEGDVMFAKLTGHSQSLREIFQDLHQRFGMTNWIQLAPTTVQSQRDEGQINALKLPVKWSSAVSGDERLDWFERPLFPRLSVVPSH